MRRFCGALILLALGATLAVGSLKYHLVQTQDRFLWFKKRSLHWTDTYADVRGWNHSTWNEHRELARAVTEQGRSDLIPSPQPFQLLKSIMHPFGSSTRTQPGSQGPQNRRPRQSAEAAKTSEIQ